MRHVVLALAMLGFLGASAVSAWADNGGSRAPVYATVPAAQVVNTANQSVVTPVWWYAGPRFFPRAYGAYYYPGYSYYSYYPGYDYSYGTPGYYSYYYPGPTYYYTYPGFAYRPYGYFGWRRWW